MPAPVLQFKRGNAGVAGTVPALRPGEPAISLNNFDFFIGIDTSVANNKFFGSHRYWEREQSGVKSLKLKLVSDNGSESINLRAPVSLGATFTYTLPATAIGYSGKVLSTNGDGDLSWVDQVNTLGVEQIVIGIGTFTNNVAFTTTTTSTSSTTGGVVIAGGLGVGGTSYFGSDLNVAGIVSFTNTTDNVLGNVDTGAVQIDGGVGIAKNLTVGAGLSVIGQSYFIGTATFYGGNINLGDSDGDNISVAGEFVSNLVPNATNTYDLGLTGKRWRNAYYSGNVDITGNLVVDGNVTVGGGNTVILYGQDVYIKNKDIILGYTTSITNQDASTDDTANHAGVAIASTVGSPLVSFVASGINTLPDTYKQMMWFHSGTLGFSTDAFAFNYGVAIGTTTMADGVRLAVGSSISMTDTTITAPVGNFGSLSGSLTGTISTATRATTVDTTSTSTNTNYHLVFTDNATSTTGATMRVDAGIYYNPSSNNLFATQFIGDLSAGTIKAADATTSMTLANSTGNVTFNGDIQLGGNDIKASDGNTNITLTSNTLTAFAGDVRVNGGDIQASDGNVNITMTSNTLTAFAGDVKVGGNDIQASDGTVALTLSSTTGNVKTGGDLIAGSGYLASANGTRAMYMYDTSGDVSFQGKVIANNFRSSSNASNTLTFTDLDATFARNVNIVGVTTTAQLTIGAGVAVTQFSASVSTGSSTSSVPTSSAVIDYVATQVGNVDLTLSLAGDTGTGSVNTSQTFTIAGTANEVNTSASGQTITVGLPDAVVVGTSLSAPTVRANIIQSQNTGATVLTLTGNDATFADDLTVQGNLYVQGSTTQIDTTSLTVEDRTIELGRIVASQPSNTTWDLAVLFNYGDGAAKKAGLVWEASGATKRFQFTTDVNPGSDGSDSQTNLPSFTVSNFAPIEIGQLWVTDCAGTSQVISCTGTERFLENITVDAGTF